MNTRESSLLKETLKRESSSVRFASIFGSCRKGDADHLSDIDVFIVCEDRADKPAIVSSLTKLSPRLGREAHTSIFTLKGFEDRIRNHDYLIASILDDSSLVFGDEEAFFEEERRIFAGPIDMESVRFNRKMGLRMIDRANDRPRSLLLNGSLPHNLELHVADDYALLACLKDYHLGLGYLAASKRMKQLNKAISLRQLSASDDYPFIKDLILTEKTIIRKRTLNLADLKNLFEYSKCLVIAPEFPSRTKIL